MIGSGPDDLLIVNAWLDTSYGTVVTADQSPLTGKVTLPISATVADPADTARQIEPAAFLLWRQKPIADANSTTIIMAKSDRPAEWRDLLRRPE